MVNIRNYSFKAMGSPCELVFYPINPQQDDKLIHAVEADIRRLEMRYSRYRKDSVISAINRVAAQAGSLVVDEETAALLNYAQMCYQQSDGLFDITSGVLRKAWDFNACQLPDALLLSSILAKVGWEKLVWQPPVLRFLVAGMELDFGGIGKEYAADRAGTLCVEHGYHHGYVNLGGDIRVFGGHPNGSAWVVGLQNPRHEEQSIGNLGLVQGGIATSGNYERYMEIDGQRYCHIINPKTGWPVQSLASVSVAAAHCLVAGSACTIAMLMEADGKEWLEKLGLPHLWVDVQGHKGGTIT
jgi:thiamine biosynthesis lipoprotein